MKHLRRGLVLLVSDDLPLRELVTSELEAMSFEVDAALDFEEASLRIAARTPRLFCVDLSLPRGSGYDVCELVRRNSALDAVPILIMSDRATPEEMADAEEAGANAFVRKPLTARRLERYVEALLERRPPSGGSIRELRPSDFPPPPEE